MDGERRRGRPRDPRRESKIVRTARDLLLERGYAAVTMEGVARDAGVSKTTVYRRWKSKADLVFDVVFGSERQAGEPLPSTSDPLADFASTIGVMAGEFTTPEAKAAVPGLLGDFASDRELQSRTNRRLVDPDYELLGKLLQRAKSHGLVEDDIDERLALDMLFGAVFLDAVILDRPLDGSGVQRLVDLLIRGIGTRREGDQ